MLTRLDCPTPLRLDGSWAPIRNQSQTGAVLGDVGTGAATYQWRHAGAYRLVYCVTMAAAGLRASGQVKLSAASAFQVRHHKW